MKTPALLAAMALAALSIVPSSTPAAAQRQVVTETITCQSIGNQRKECRVRGRIQDVQPVASFTNAPCIFGSTWGFDRRNVWVDQGCYAEFNVEVSRKVTEAEPVPQQTTTTVPTLRETITETVDCRSLNFGRKECRVKGKIQNVEKVGTFSAFRCNLGTSWGSEDRYVWVDRGCAARFNVTFTRRTKPIAPTPAPTPTVTEAPTPSDTPANPLGDRTLQAVIAQGACAGLYPGAGNSGKPAMVFAVPRTCSTSAPDCRAVCANVSSTISQPNFRRFVSTRPISCFNSLHVYDRGIASRNGTVGTATVAYNSCEGGCGPNFCCCGAQ